MPFTLFVGYDPREDLTFRVLRHSIERRASIPVNIVPLDHMALRRAGMFRRPYEVTEAGQMVDKKDGKPFSTAFSFTRFLVPEIARQAGHQWPVGFVDCDFLFLEDVAKLLDTIDHSKAVSVVKHNFEPNYTSKMDGMAQTVYSRKLWSSLMIVNQNHPSNFAITPERVNTAPGSWLHGFGWLAADEIGDIPESWNWLPSHSPTLGKNMIPDAVHYTDGSPQMPQWRNQPYADLWLDELERFAEKVGKKPLELLR